jgi:hypothetical protein
MKRGCEDLQFLGVNEATIEDYFSLIEYAGNQLFDTGPFMQHW